MEIGTEISQKVRSAIKAKLVDLGAYVDDELPDYIMVMVANRKSKEQMTDDLNLFLGNNTIKFTEWLSALLDKLQLLASKEEANKAKEQAENAEKNQDTAELSSTAAPTEEDKPESGIDRKKASDQTSKQAEQTTSTGRKRSMSDGRGGSTISPKKSRVSESNDTAAKKDKPHETVQAAIEPDIVLAADNEVLFGEEPEEAPKKKPVVQHMKGVRVSTDSRNKPSRDDLHPKTQVTSKTTEKLSTSASSGRESVRSRLGDVSEPATGDSATKRRRPLTSAIGAVVKHPSPEPSEEQYDPYRPAIGKVASKVKITERKSKVPTNWQADKSILLKAVNAAQTSIEKSSSRREKAIVKPVSRREPSPKRHRSSAHRRPRDRSRSPHRGMRSDRVSKSSARHGTSRGPESGRGAKERKIQVFSRAQEDEALSRLRSKVLDRKPLADRPRKRRVSSGGSESDTPVQEKAASPKAEKTEGSSVADEDVLDLSVPEDQRLIEYESDDASHPDVPRYKATPITRPFNTLVESGAEDSDFTDGEGEDSRVVRQHERRVADRPESPKFVVTLDGVDPVLLKTEVKFDSESEAEPEPILQAVPPKPERNIVRVEPRPQQPMVQPVTMVNLGDDDEEYDGDENMMTEEAQKAVSPERCHFWPACKNGSSCPYVHPSEPCRNFPACKFGDKCMFVHPDCKFDANCTKLNCPFTHSQKKMRMPTFAQSMPVIVQPIKVPVYTGGFYPQTRPPRPPTPAASQPPGQVTCKFFPLCTNMNCPYNHPKPCRFGVSCNNKETCRFSHPKLPSKDQLSWSTKTSAKAIDCLPSPDVSPIVVNPNQVLTSSPTS